MGENGNDGCVVYVDDVFGSDSKDGKSINNALKTRDMALVRLSPEFGDDPCGCIVYVSYNREYVGEEDNE